MNCGEPYESVAIQSRWFLVRHGETDWNREDIVQGSSDTHLNEKGRAQAKATAAVLKGKNIDLIISSDLSRAKETAEFIAEETGAEMIFDASLREMDFGELEGKSIPEVNKKYGGFLERPYKELGGETFEEVEQRAMEALRKHREDYIHKNIVIVSHGSLLGLVMKNIKRITAAEARASELNNAGVIELEIGEPCKKCGADVYELWDSKEV